VPLAFWEPARKNAGLIAKVANPRLNMKLFQNFSRAAETQSASALPAPHVNRSPARSWLAALLFIGVPFIAANVLTKLLTPAPELRDVNNQVKVLVLLTAYWAYVRWWEGRAASELSLKRALPEIVVGLVLGALIFSAVVAVLAWLGAYSIHTVGSATELWAAVANMLPKMMAGAVLEELLFRLIALRLLERSFGTAWALAISSLLFGLAHLGNVGASPLISTMLGIELGLLFGAAYLLTRSLWFCTALHLSWNFAQGAVFSIAVSGHSGAGWLRGNLVGPDWLTGGAFGAEGSVIALVLCLTTTTGLLMLAYQRGHFKRRGAT
jgi:uncharacterized protein